MNRVFVHGLGAVSPAGWGTEALHAAIEKQEPIPTQTLTRPGQDAPVRVRPAPPPPVQPTFLRHPRLRRASAITHYVLAAALEALGADACPQRCSRRLGIVVCVTAGGVSYSRRFFEELMRDPATASPLVFPETVFNAPASHLAAYLGASGMNYTLVGDSGTFLQGLALGAALLSNGRADGCIVVGAEETDWIMADALRRFQRTAVHGSGAGAIYLQPFPTPGCGAELSAVTDSFPFVSGGGRAEAARKMRAQLPIGGPDELLSLGTQGSPRLDRAEEMAWSKWPGVRLALKATLGEGFAASAAWQCVAACDILRHGRHTAANISVLGASQQAIGARFIRMENPPALSHY